MQTPTYLRDPLAQLYLAARTVCKEIERREVDLVLAAASGGEAAALAAQALWRATQPAPFPPLVVLDLSIQHTKQYPPFANRYASDIYLDHTEIRQMGPFMAWVAGQEDWQAQLRARVEAAAGPGFAAKSVLVVGDNYGSDVVGPLALGLVAAVYPDSRTVYLPDPVQLTVFPPLWVLPFLDLWLYSLPRPLIARVDRLIATDADTWTSAVNDLIVLAYGHASDEARVGQTLDPGSLSADHPAFDRLGPLFGRSRLEALPRWVRDALQTWVVRRHKRQMRPARRRHFKPLPKQYAHLYELPGLQLAAGSLWARRRLTVGEISRIAGIDVDLAETAMQSVSQPGFIEAEPGSEANGAAGKAYLLRDEVGILAYGSLRLDPGSELTPWIARRIPTTTPFPVEYVRSNPTRCGAPVLVPVPEGYGAAAPADVLVLTPGIDVKTARDMLLKRKLDRAGDEGFWVAADQDEMTATELKDYAGVSTVLYAAGGPNLPEVVPPDVPLAEKGEVLARLAIASLTPETYAKGHDGIRYLADAVAQGIVTPLTEPYKAVLLRLAGDAPDLAEARRRVAARLGVEG